MSRRGGRDLLGAVVTLAAAVIAVTVLGLVVSNRQTPAALPDGWGQSIAADQTASPSPSGAEQALAAAAFPDRQAIKRMLYAAARKHGVNAGLVMGLAWWESGWNQSAVSSTGAIGIMQVEPYTADGAGPRLLHRKVDVHELSSNIELGTAILKANLDRYRGDITKALTAYYAGPSAVADWAHLDADVQRYVLGIYRLAVAFDQGTGPV